MNAPDGDGDSPASEPDGTDASSPGHRRHRMLAMLDDGGRYGGPGGLLGLRDRLLRVCVVTVTEVGVDGAGVTIMGSRDGGIAGHRDQLASTGALTRRLEDLQLTMGEGPCLDAYAGGLPVLAGDIAEDPTRWLGFGPEALAVGAGALFSLPLQVGAVRLGTLDLNRVRTGPLSPDQLADALALAALATETLLELAEPIDPVRADSYLENSGSDRQREPAAGWLPDVHADVHVASGIVSAQANIDVGAALLRIRAHAFASSEPIHGVARRIIDRELVLDDPGTEPADPAEDGPPALDPENGDS